jgi:magnesium transporter
MTPHPVTIPEAKYMRDYSSHLEEPVTGYIRTDSPLLAHTLTVSGALDVILERGLGDRIVYFYVVDEENRLLGVIPTRRLLISPRDRKLTEVMIPKLVKLPHTAIVYDACELFAMYRFLAIPVVDEENRMLGIVDISLFTDEMVTEGDSADSGNMCGVFETIGLRLAELRTASPFAAFRYRFPWLLATIASGTACAFLAGAFGATIAEALVIAFFMTLLLQLGESVGMQSMTMTIQTLASSAPTFSWFVKALRREIAAAFLLGMGSGAIVSVIVFLWQGSSPAVFAIGASIVVSITGASALGLAVPTFIHALKLDPKIAAGPMTLALADIFTLFNYFLIASAVL